MIRLVWVLDHSGIAGNYKAAELVRTGASVLIAAEWQRVGALLASCGSLLECWASEYLSKR